MWQKKFFIGHIHPLALAIHYGKEKVKSVNLYQLFSYLLNQRSEDPRSWHTTGMLIYPSTSQELKLNLIPLLIKIWQSFYSGVF